MTVSPQLKSFFNKLWGFLKIYQAPILSGLLSGTSYIPFPPWAAVFMWVPLWWFVSQQKKLKSVLIGAWLCQFIGTLIGFNWVAYTIQTFGQMPWIAAILGLFFFCAFSNIFMVIACAAWFVLVHRSPTPLSTPFKLILFPLLFSLFHSLIPMLFPWNMGYVWLWAGLPLFQTAEIWGARFLNTLIYVFNLCFLILYKHRWDLTGKKALATVAGLFISLNIFGFYLKHRLPERASQLKVLMVQSNIGHLRKDSEDSSSSLKKQIQSPARRARITLKELTYKGLIKFRKQYEDRSHVNFILWPEGAYPYTINKSQDHVSYITRQVQKFKIPLITGGTGENHKGYTNSLFIFNREGKLLKPVYDKVKLLAFGEYMPGPFQLSFVKKFLPYFQGHFIPGQNPAVQRLEEIPLGLQICYESLFDKMTRRIAQEGAQIL
ncbi:MAG: apolipoprotein N-acyltransferase, partial [Bdellovibrionales bacterium]|nr:apolipoprotein N-acyltransferase [Bdellovibrionales bacterium]